MIEKKDLKKLADCIFSIPETFRWDMRVPAILFASDEMLEEIIHDRSLEQLVNVTTLPGIWKAAFAMPDVHEGYGFPIGGVAATLYPDGVISPGGIGYDINCGVRLLLSSLSRAEVEPYFKKLSHALFREVPSGVGHRGGINLETHELDSILKEGSQALMKRGFCTEKDLHFHESEGRIEHADPNCVSEHAKKRGQDQLGTLGAGNHFIEVDVVTNIFNEEIASTFGLHKDQVAILIHTGSRGLGHQVATDYIRLMNHVMPRYNINLPDRELACVPFSSEEGRHYFAAMAAAANFAFANRQMITHQIRSAWKHVFGTSQGELSLLYDVTHNMAKIEEHTIDGEKRTCIVHRKGATRALPPHHFDLISEFQTSGQPVLIPGSMGTSSFVLAGSKTGSIDAFTSSCHGAGRRMSRHQAKLKIQGRGLLEELTRQGICIETGSIRDLPEEAPFAYKDVHQVVETVAKVGIAQKVAELKPIIVIKG